MDATLHALPGKHNLPLCRADVLYAEASSEIHAGTSS